MPPVTICVLTYGPYLELAKRVIDSVRTHCGRSQYVLIVGANAVESKTHAYLEMLRADHVIDHFIVSERNLNKCPMMAQIFKKVETEFIWWFDDDSYIICSDALSRRLQVARSAPPHYVMWGHVFYFSNAEDFSYRTDVVGYVKRAPWFRGKEPPSWMPGGKDEFDFQGTGRGDGRWFFPTGGCWFVRTSAIRTLDWPDATLVKRNDDVFLAEAIRQQGWEFIDIGPCGVAINTEARRGEGEDRTTMEYQIGRRLTR